jgi:hypothetical protein
LSRTLSQNADHQTHVLVLIWSEYFLESTLLDKNMQEATSIAYLVFFTAAMNPHQYLDSRGNGDAKAYPWGMEITTMSDYTPVMEACGQISHLSAMTNKTHHHARRVQAACQHYPTDVASVAMYYDTSILHHYFIS